MTTQLVGDIGGTKTILRLEEVETGKQLLAKDLFFLTSHFPKIEALVKFFLEKATQELGYQPKIDKACFAVPGPIINNTSAPPNLPEWFIDAHVLQEELGITKIHLINDFEAIGYGIPKLTATNRYILQPGNPQKHAVIGIIGAGTGLGEGFLTWQGEEGYQVHASEGGHSDFSPRSELQFQLFQYLQKKFKTQVVSVIRVVSGPGILAIYQFLRDTQATPELPEISHLVVGWEQQAENNVGTLEPAEAIAKMALEKRNRLCEQTMEIFVEVYGAEAGNLALKILPYGGLYVAGGIAPKILPLLEENNRFLRAFIGKGRMGRTSALLERIPIYVVMEPKIGLIGAAVYASLQVGK